MPPPPPPSLPTPPFPSSSALLRITALQSLLSIALAARSVATLLDPPVITTFFFDTSNDYTYLIAEKLSLGLTAVSLLANAALILAPSTIFASSRSSLSHVFSSSHKPYFWLTFLINLLGVILWFPVLVFEIILHNDYKVTHLGNVIHIVLISLFKLLLNVSALYFLIRYDISYIKTLTPILSGLQTEKELNAEILYDPAADTLCLEPITKYKSSKSAASVVILHPHWTWSSMTMHSTLSPDIEQDSKKTK